MRGSCSPESMFTIRLPPPRVFMVTNQEESAVTSPMRLPPPCQRDGLAWSPERAGVLRRNNGNQIAFIGDVKRIKAENLARPFDFLADGDSRLIEKHAHACGLGDFVEHGGNTASRRIAQHVNIPGGVEHGLHQAVQRGGVAGNFGFKFQPLPHKTDAGSVDKNFVRLAAIHNFCVPPSRA